MTSPEQSNPPGEAPAQTYGVPMYDIATPTTPEWLDGGTTAAPSGVEALAPTGVSAKACVRLALRVGDLSLRGACAAASLRGLLLRRSAAAPRRSSDASSARRSPSLTSIACCCCARCGDELLHLRASRSASCARCVEHRRP